MTTERNETIQAMSKIHGGAMKAFKGLTNLQQGDVIQYLINNPSKVLIVPSDVIDAWLCWNGIIGYTEAIIELVTNIA
jgi:hypothetical protein